MATSTLTHNPNRANAAPTVQHGTAHERTRPYQGLGTRILGKLALGRKLQSRKRGAAEQKPLVAPKIPLEVFDPIDTVKTQHRKVLRPNDRVVFDKKRPVASAYQVEEATGADIGAIVGYFDIPGEEQSFDADRGHRRVYIIDPNQTTYQGRHRAQGAETPGVLLLGHDQLQQIAQSQADGGRTPMPKLIDEVPYVIPGTPAYVGRGEESWLPASEATRANKPKLYDAVSRKGIRVEVLPDGNPAVAVIKGNPVQALGGPRPGEAPFNQLVPAVDPWPEATTQPYLQFIDNPRIPH